MVPVEQVTREQIVGYIDSEARARLGKSASDMLREYREGRLEDPGKVGDLLVVSELLTKNDPLFGS